MGFIYVFIRLLNEVENCPDNWFRRTTYKLWDENVAAAARFLGSDPKNLVLTVNATTGKCHGRQANKRENDILL